jgi:hypothetical protein
VLESCKAGRLSDVKKRFCRTNQGGEFRTSELKDRASKLDAEQLSKYIVQE